MPDKCDCPPEGLPGWMGTFADLVTLLLCFFVLLFAFSTMDSQKFQSLMKTFQGSFGVLTGGKTMSPESLITNTRINTKGQTMKFLLLSKKLQEKLDEIEEIQELSSGDEWKSADGQAEKDKENEADNVIDEKEKIATVKVTRRGIEISLGDQTLFESGKAKMKPKALKVLDALIVELKGLENEIVVEGHTDNIPINSIRFPSNWELSTARATTVLRYLLEKIPSQKGKLSAAGYADTKPLASNKTPEGRSQNRRVDIIVLKNMQERLQEELAKNQN